MRLLLAFLLTLSTLFSALAAQTPYIDSLQNVVQQEGYSDVEYIEAYNALGWTYRRINLDTGFFYLQQVDKLLGEEPYDSLRFSYNYNLATLYRYKGDYPKTIEILEECLAYAKKAGNLEMEGKVCYPLSFTYNENKEPEKAITLAQRAKDIFRELGIIEREIGSMNVLATILKDINRKEAATEVFLEAARLGEEHNIPYQLEPIYNNMASNFVAQGMIDQAHKYYQKALLINEQAEDRHGMATVQGNIADLYLRENKHEQAYSYLLKSLEGKELIGAEEDLPGIRAKIGAIQIYQGQKQKGLLVLEKNLEIAQTKGYKNEEYAILQVLIKSTYENEMYEAAALYQKQYIALQDTSFNTLLNSKVNELNSKYQKAEQDQEIALLNSENALQQERISRQRLQLWGGGAILLLVSLLMFSIYRLNRKLNDQNGIITKALKEKEILLKEIHHRVKNNLQVISSLLNLQAYRIKDEVALEAIKEGRTRVQSMSLIHQTLYRKDNLTGVNISDYLDKLCQSLFFTYKVSEEQINLKTNISPLMLDVDSVVPLGLIINELITNSLKYAFPKGRNGNINIKIEEIQEGLLLVVNDDGIGIEDVTTMQHGDSFGYELIHAFSQKLEGNLSIKSQDGTQVSLLIRKYEKAA